MAIKHRITYNGFHGRRTITFRGKPDAHGIVRVSRRVARRLNRAVCGISDCQCGEGVAEEETPQTYVVRLPEKGSEIPGYHPQS